MMMDKMVMSFSFWSVMFSRKIERTPSTALKQWKSGVILNGWYENILKLCTLNLTFCNPLYGNITYPTGILRKVARVSLRQWIVFTGDEIRPCSARGLWRAQLPCKYKVLLKCQTRVPSLAGWADSKAQGRTLLECQSNIWCFGACKKHKIKPSSDK